MDWLCFTLCLSFTYLDTHRAVRFNVLIRDILICGQKETGTEPPVTCSTSESWLQLQRGVQRLVICFTEVTAEPWAIRDQFLMGAGLVSTGHNAGGGRIRIVFCTFMWRYSDISDEGFFCKSLNRFLFLSHLWSLIGQKKSSNLHRNLVVWPQLDCDNSLSSYTILMCSL